MNYRDANLPIEARVDDLVSRMTLEEKIGCMCHDSRAIPRLGIHEYNWWNECLHGVGRAGIATVFPQVIGLAATWNAELIREIGSAIGDEARAKHHEALRRGDRGIYKGLTMWSPNINIFRDPRWGRGQETWGEDPHLTGELASQFIQGIQGDDPHYWKTTALVKHFAVHSGPEPKRHVFNPDIDERDLRETYLEAFRTTTIVGGSSGVMSAYNALDGIPCSAHKRLLTDVLREEWRFDGYVVSDVGAIQDIYKNHHYVKTPEEACALAVKAGCDLNGGWQYNPHLRTAVAKGLITEQEIDVALRRLFRILFRLGMFDPAERVPYASIPPEVNDCAAHRALARRAACESIVLLKNEGGLLPLRLDLKRIAVIGPNADSVRSLLGNYHGTPSAYVTPLAGIRAAAGNRMDVVHAKGCDLAASTGDMVTVPKDALRWENEGKVDGLRGHYYNGHGFGGAPVLERVDGEVDFAWGDQVPDTEHLTGRRFCARWEGWLEAPRDGTYRIGVTADAAIRLYWNEELLCEKLPLHGSEIKSRTLELRAGERHAVRIDYDGNTHAASARLLWLPPVEDAEAPIREAVELARTADVAIVCLGLTADLEGEEGDSGGAKGFLGGDRLTLDLPGDQQQLLERIHATGTPVVLVLLSGSALGVSWAKDNVPAIVQAWYPGEEGGSAIADVLFGRHNPAGRLPVTLYQSVDNLPDFEDYRMENRTYRFFRGEPLYPFGHGLGYTRFAYSDLHLSARRIAAGEKVEVTVDVTNSGSRAGDEVVQLYVSDLEASGRVPIRSLRGFGRIRLGPGESRTVHFCLAPRALSMVRADGRRIVEPGRFEIFVGGMQPGTAQDCGAVTTEVLSVILEVGGSPLELEP